MNQKEPMPLIMIPFFLAMGGLFIVAAIKDWDWIFNSYKYRRWVKLLGRKTVRIIFGLLGLMVCLLPIYSYLF